MIGTLSGLLCLLLVVVFVLFRRGNERIELAADNLRKLSVDMARRASEKLGSGSKKDEEDFASPNHNHHRLDNDDSHPSDMGYPDKKFLGSDAVDSQGNH